MSTTPTSTTPVSTWTPSEVQRRRDAYRRGRVRRSVMIAGLSTVVVAGVLATAVTSAPGWPRVRESFFSLEDARAALPEVAVGLWLNIRLFLVCSVFILIFGLLTAVARTLRGPVFWPLRAIATLYVDLFRGLPLILVLLIVGLGVPGLRLQGIPTDFAVLGGVALILSYSAYVAEVLRAGIESVHPSQRAAARSLGLSAGQTLRHVVLPQGIRRVVPALLNDFVSLQKDSGLVSIIGAADAVANAGIYTARTFNFTSYVVAGLLFVALTIPMTRLTDRLARRRGQVPMGGHL